MNKNLLTIAFLLPLLLGCAQKQRFDVDMHNAKPISIHRVDIDLIGLDTSKMAIETEKLFQKYPAFMSVFFAQMIELPIDNRPVLENELKSFLSDTLFAKVNADVLQSFADVSDIETEVGESYARIAHFFPEIKLPELYLFVSGFNRSVVVTPAFIAVGVDMYLGSDYPEYNDISYKYLAYNMRRESIAVDVISAVLFAHFSSDVENDRLLDNMLYRGKVLYTLATMMPGRLPHDIIGYTKFQWEWSRKYEKEIWNTIVDNQDIYSSDVMLMRKYLNDAPFTSPVSQDSPGRLGVWVGWQIVDAWMKKDKTRTLKDLIAEKNYQKMLTESGYQP
ncbi:MAG: hypothetical protein JXR27_12255 [Paludibacteraceae bacterium]|nr:hypothetical protein [Paludibacteraceae bacterium]